MSEIFHGRQVRDVWVLERIADGFGVARAWMGLGYGEQDPDLSSAEKDVDEDMKRRAVIAATSLAALGQVIEGLGEPIELALPSAQLPSRLGMSHVHAVRTVTQRLVSVTRYYSCTPKRAGPVTTRVWMGAATSPVPCGWPGTPTGSPTPPGRPGRRWSATGIPTMR
ncbi:MAG: hypothetical protein ACRDRA_13590 [Pseudonocardiaceae bacterium]